MDDKSKQIIKKVTGHLKEDEKTFRHEIEDDIKLRKAIKKTKPKRLEGKKK